MYKIVIGKHDIDNNIIKNNGSWSTRKVFEYSDFYISENSFLFYISGILFDGDMLLSKYHKDGIKLKTLISKNKGVPIQKFLEKLVIRNIDAKDLLNCIESIKKEYFDKGLESKQEEICNVLGLNKYL